MDKLLFPLNKFNIYPFYVTITDTSSPTYAEGTFSLNLPIFSLVPGNKSSPTAATSTSSPTTAKFKAAWCAAPPLWPTTKSWSVPPPPLQALQIKM